MNILACLFCFIAGGGAGFLVTVLMVAASEERGKEDG